MSDNTSIEKTFDPAAIEQRHYDVWEKSGAFAARPESNAAPFTIMMPPPNVTGSLHIGHGLTMTLQDVLTRFYRLKGRDSLWQPGTDHAGIATQLVVERQLAAQGQRRDDFTREEFLKKVWEWKAQSGGTIMTQLRRLGTTADWARERFTMDEGLSKAVLKVFVTLYNQGLIYRDKRLVNWDPKMHTALSDLEVVQKETKGHLWHIEYEVEGDTARTITVATTRPETLLGDTGIAVHPEDERYADLIGKFAIVPIVNRPVPIIADDFVDREHGSGAVKITPAHDFTDFEVGKRHKLEVINILDKNAALNENVPEKYRGLDRFDARKKVLAELESLDQLVRTEDITHVVPYDEKSKQVVLEPLLTDQWFVDAATLAKPALEAVETGKTQFVPKHWENTYYEWLRNIQPWCISRQIWWGHQIPAWFGPDEKIFVAETEAEAQAQADAHYGEKTLLKRDSDVLDTWFSSALWPFSTLGWPEQTPELAKYYPGDVLVTGFDIIFFWVARMMMMGIHFMGDVPFRTVYIHGLVRDGQGQKMSKTKGNVIDPLDIVKEYGADALRFTLVAFAAQGRDIKLSEERVAGYRNFATKLWNAARYCQMNGCAPVADYRPENARYAINRWILAQLADTARNTAKAIEEYRFSDAASGLYHFIWGTFCDWYLEFTKSLLNGEEGAEIKATTAFVLDQILLILNPIMPFITEELYEKLGDRNGAKLLEARWPEYAFDVDTWLKSTDAEIGVVQKIISEIRSVRADMGIVPGAQLHLNVMGANDASRAIIQSSEALIKRMARLASITLVDAADSKGSIQCVVNEMTLLLPVADIIDLAKERERLNKELARVTSDMQKTEQKLGNPQFVANAPEEIIAEQKQRLDDAKSAIQKLSSALRNIS